MQPSARTLQLDDIGLAYWSLGEGKPLIVLHGGPGLGHTYMRALDPWAAEFRLIYFDQRGSGDSPTGEESRLSVQGGLEDLEGLRSGLSVNHANLVGHSFGALLALAYAARRPDRTASLVLLNPAPPLVPELAEQLSTAMRARRQAEDDAAQAEITESDAFRRREPKAVERLILNVYLPFFTQRRIAETLDLGFTSITAENVLELEERFLEELMTLRPLEALSRIRCPTLILHGALDPTPVESSRLFAERIPGAQLAVLEDAGHFAHVDEPERVAKTVLPFLRAHAR